MSTQEQTSPRPAGEGAVRRISPYLLWYGVLGGAVGWAVHVLLAWSFMEVSCLSPTGADVDQRGGSPGTVTWIVVWAGTIGPWLLAAGAFAAILVVRARLRADQRAGLVDVLAGERTALLVVLGVFLDLMSLAAVTGGVIALLTLEPCG